MALVLTSDGFIYVDKNANIVIKEHFDEAFDFKEGLAQVCIDNQWGFINTNGEFVLDLQFENVNDLSNGIYELSKNGHKFYLEYNGKITLNPFSQRQIACISKDIGWRILRLLELKE